MSDANLCQLLTQVHERLGQADSVDPQSHKLLVAVRHDIERFLGRKTSDIWVAVVLAAILVPQVLVTLNHPVPPASSSAPAAHRQSLAIQCVSGLRYHLTAPASEPVEIILREQARQDGSECSLVP